VVSSGERRAASGASWVYITATAHPVSEAELSYAYYTNTAKYSPPASDYQRLGKLDADDAPRPPEKVDVS